MKVGRDRGTTILTVNDIEKIGIEKTIEIALEVAWKGASAVYLSFDIDSVDAGFVPGTGWPEPGGLLPREALKLVEGIAKEGIVAMELVEVSPPYDISDITSLLGARLMVDVLAVDDQEQPHRRPSESPERVGPWSAPVFILATELQPRDAAWPGMRKPRRPRWSRSLAHTSGWRHESTSPACRHDRRDDPGEYHLGRVIDRRAGDGASVHLRVARRVRPEYLAADDAGPGAGRGAPPACRGLDPSRYGRSHPSLARRLFRRPGPAGAGRAGPRAAAGRTAPRRRRAGRARHPRRLLPPDAVDLGASRPGPGRGRLRPPPAAVPAGRPRALPERAARLAPATAVPVGRASCATSPA